MGRLISEKYKEWEKECRERFDKMKKNEEELNRIFIDVYGLNDELKPEEDDKDVTVRLANEEREIKSLISYAVGCMMGRYSLDEDGIVFAGGTFDINKYHKYIPDNDGIIPIFEIESVMPDDIVNKFIDFIKVAYGEDTLDENLKYIVKVLKKGSNGDYKDIIRKYFVSDFYADHLKIYQKKPIYWLFDSGKKNGCKFLVYLHRYHKDILGKIKIDYMPTIQRAYNSFKSDIDNKLLSDDTLSKKEIQDMKKISKDLQNKIDECKDFYDAISHMAEQRIELSLDDGVDVNYEKFSFEDKDKKKVINLLAKR